MLFKCSVIKCAEEFKSKSDLDDHILDEHGLVYLKQKVDVSCEEVNILTKKTKEAKLKTEVAKNKTQFKSVSSDQAKSNTTNNEKKSSPNTANPKLKPKENNQIYRNCANLSFVGGYYFV